MSPSANEWHFFSTLLFFILGCSDFDFYVVNKNYQLFQLFLSLESCYPFRYSKTINQVFTFFHSLIFSTATILHGIYII